MVNATLIDFLSSRAVESYYASVDESKRDYEWRPLFNGYAKAIVMAFDLIDEKEKAMIKGVLERRGQMVEPLPIEGLYHFDRCHNLLNNLNKKGSFVPLLELLMVEHDLEYFVRPNLLRMYWVLSNATGDHVSYIGTLLQKKGNEGGKEVWISGSIKWAKDGLQKVIHSKADNILDQDERECFQSFLDSIKEEKESPLAPDNLRNWIAHRDFLLTDDGFLFNLNNGARNALHYSYAELRGIRDVTLDLCRIVIYLNFMFDWAASHILNNVTLDEIDGFLRTAHGETEKA